MPHVGQYRNNMFRQEASSLQFGHEDKMQDFFGQWEQHSLFGQFISVQCFGVTYSIGPCVDFGHHIQHFFFFFSQRFCPSQAALARALHSLTHPLTHSADSERVTDAVYLGSSVGVETAPRREGLCYLVWPLESRRGVLKQRRSAMTYTADGLRSRASGAETSSRVQSSCQRNMSWDWRAGREDDSKFSVFMRLILRDSPRLFGDFIEIWRRIVAGVWARSLPWDVSCAAVGLWCLMGGCEDCFRNMTSFQTDWDHLNTADWALL